MGTSHEVLNQPPPLAGYDVYGEDEALVEALHREGAVWADDELRELGRRAGSAEAIASGAQANAFPPVLRTHDRYGNRVDEVEYHPGYHDLLRTAIGQGIHGRPWAQPRPGAHVARAAEFVVWYQVDAGHCCPVSMAYSAVPALRATPELADEWEPRVTSEAYDPRCLPAAEKTGALIGMAMTEKQGGSDVRANTTRAEPVPGGPGEYRLTGHKWFFSAPMSDAVLVLAQAPGGLSCFLMPRFLPDGNRNTFFLQRLKDKLGNRSNASSEVELEGAWARLGDLEQAEYGARRLVGDLALALEGSLVVRHGHPAVADAFCASRLDGESRLVYGTLPRGVDTGAIVERARPKVP